MDHGSALRRNFDWLGAVIPTMPKLSPMCLPFRFSAAIAVASLLGLLSISSTPAAASTTQLSIIQDGPLLLGNTDVTLARFRLLGANAVRVIVPWFKVTRNPTSFKRPKNFNAADPNAYPNANWAPYDNIVREAKTDGITVDFTVAGGSPAWADGPGVPKGGVNSGFAWKPSAKEYGLFLTAVAKRYSGSFKVKGVALPRVHFWTIYNEPNFGQDLGPQAINGSSVSVAPGMYRNIVDAGWKALHATGHGHDTILIGEFAARGNGFHGPTSRLAQGLPGNYGQTKPLEFIRTLYCLDSNYHQLRGSTAAARGCPTNAAGSRRFRSQHPGLFSASGVGDHPYPGNGPPLSRAGDDPNFATFPDLGRFGAELDRVNRIYGSPTHYPIYNDEYAYITSPPKPHGTAVSPDTASFYINWAEYLSYKNPRIKSYMQYLLQDPQPTGRTYSGFASGLLFPNGRQKSDYGAYRLPLYMPVTSSKRGKSLEVWGDLRTTHAYRGQTVDIQFASGSSSTFTTVKALKVTNSTGYFDLQMKFPGSGTVRLSCTYPKTDPLLPVTALGATVFSRHVKLTLH
jgi:hypothetical protein